MKETRKKAAALSYDKMKEATPKIAAIGKGLVADKIVETAQQNNVPVLEDPSLVELLSNLNVNETIPAELYEAVAEVFAFVYKLDQKQEV